MPIDNELKKLFEIADDGMQGVLGYFYYVLACHSHSVPTEIQKHLPNHSINSQTPAIQISYDWVRFYSPTELSHLMGKMLPLFHSRICLISLVGIFEGFLTGFIVRLTEIGKIKPLHNYKSKLEWAFRQIMKDVKPADVGNISNHCLLLDHGRRIRNLCLHNKGLFNDRYETDFISITGKTPLIHPSFQEYQKTHLPTPCLIQPQHFEEFCRAHIRFVHFLHTNVQKEFFDPNYQGYSYKGESKRIEWHRLLVGG